jgi:hypothetical protein
MMNTPVPTANESAVSAASLEKPLAPDSPPTDLHALGFRLYHRRVTFLARRMPEAFAVYTSEGVQQGAAGDYVILNLAGECWPIPARLFEQTYGQAAS